MSLQLTSYLKAHIFWLFTGPRNEHQFCAADQWTPINTAHIPQTMAQVPNLAFIPFHISALGMFWSKTQHLNKIKQKTLEPLHSM
jgi:hypothetical protein